MQAFEAVLRLQRAIGNRALSDLLQRDAAPDATVVTSPLLPQIQRKLPRWLQDTIRTDEARREYLLALYAKLGPLWNHVPDDGITWIGTAGEMEFTPDDEGSLKADLLKAGYTDSYFAATGSDRWGLREPGVLSGGLHWRGEPGGKINVHIDLHPPSGTGFWHWIEDKERRSTTHTKEAIRQSLEAQKVDIPVLSQQDLHGRLTVRLQTLGTTVGDNAAAGAALDGARDDLTKAGAILWNRETVTQDQLKDAAVLLAHAGQQLDAAAPTLFKK